MPHPRRILRAAGAISVHGSFRQASLEPGSSGQELWTLPTGQLRPPMGGRKLGVVSNLYDRDQCQVIVVYTTRWYFSGVCEKSRFIDSRYFTGSRKWTKTW